MKLISQVKVPYDASKDVFLSLLAKKARVLVSDITHYEILKMGIDARKKPNIFFVYNVAIDVKKNVIKKLDDFENISVNHDGLYYERISYGGQSPIVVGFGPSGMFCALALALAGLRPIVLEQGKKAKERLKDVEHFWKTGELNEYSNVQYGEGGAGTFSDGKLNTTLNNDYCKKVINEFILCGAPSEIFYKNKAHIGTDNLMKIVQNIRKKIEKLGGKVIFNAKFTNFDAQNAQINSVHYVNLLDGKSHKLQTDNLILAIGHSAYDTFKMIKSKNVQMHKKPFAIGVRIEHPQEIINLSQYGIKNSPFLPSADYKLVEHLKSGRSVFTFCMCPGGYVVASSSEKGGVVTNGMSNFARDGKNANSALLVNVTPDDFFGESVLAGFELQRQIEKTAYLLAGANYNAPAMSVGEFLNGVKPCKTIEPTYRPNVTMCNINECLPEFVVSSLKEALIVFDKKIHGFANKNNILIAPETRSSCPVQLKRDADYTCSLSGLYACGEGAGYAGGIVSSAVDGIKCAEKIINKLNTNC